MQNLKQKDPELFDVLKREAKREIHEGCKFYTGTLLRNLKGSAFYVGINLRSA